jgi:L-ascorbate metabolism protein UlaG (beta-lactamase superfamily)
MRTSWRLGWVLAFGAAFVGCASVGDCQSPYAQSPQFKDCRFANPPNPLTPPGASTWANWTRFLTQSKHGTVPVDPLPVRPVSTEQLEALDARANHFVRLGHSAVLLKLQGAYWLIDPMLGERASPVGFAGPKRFAPPPITREHLPPIEGLVLSHDHYDHLDAPTIELLALKVKRYFVPLGLKARLVDMGVPPERVQEFDWWQSSTQGAVTLTAAPSQHFSGRTLWDRNRTLWASWVIEAGGQRLYYSGDSGYSGAFQAIGERFGGFDVALIENGEYDAGWPAVHMTPEESLRAFRDLRARVLVPVHNCGFDLAFHTWHEPLDRLAALAEAGGVDLATPELGEVVTLGSGRVNRRWWVGLR